MIEKSKLGLDPSGYIDQYGNFELIDQPWMEEEPGVVWRPVFFENQLPLENNPWRDKSDVDWKNKAAPQPVATCAQCNKEARNAG